MEVLETYTLRKGTKDVGREYEIVITTLISLRLCFNTRIDNFKITMNNDYWSDFDDCVLEIEYKDVINNNEKKQFEIFAIQLKHTEKNVCYENLINPSGDYSLNKYYQAFQQIKKNKKINNNDSIKINYILYTTAGYSKTINKFNWNDLEMKKINKNLQFFDEFLKTNNNKNPQCTFQFVSNDNNEEINEFLSNFYIFTNQGNYNKLLHEIRDIIADNYPYVDDISKEMLFFVDKWSKGQLGGYYKLTKNEILMKLFELLLLPYIKEPYFNYQQLNNISLINRLIKIFDIVIVSRQIKVDIEQLIWSIIFENILKFLVDNNSDNIEDLIENFNKQLWIKPSILLRPQIYEKFSKFWLYEKLEARKISLKSIYLMLWKSNLIPLVLKIVDRTDCLAIVKILESLKNFNLNMNFIIQMDEEYNQNFEEFSKFRRLKDIQINSGIFEEILKTITISIQNRFEVNLGQLYQNDGDVVDKITSEMVLDLVENKKILGAILNSYNSIIYIDRKITKVYIKFEILQFLNDLLVIICDNDDDKQIIENLYKSRIATVENYNSDRNLLLVSTWKIPENLQNFHIFRLIKIGKPYKLFTLEWLDSATSTEILNQYLDDPYENLEEFGLFSNYNRINIISAGPGMGKSTLINRMSQICLKEVWIIKIDLNQHSRYFNSNNLSEPLAYFIEKLQYDYLTRCCLEAFVKTKRIFLFLDGFDEISPRYTEPVLEIIENFRKNSFTQWITTRPVTCDILQKQFNTLPLSILPFNNEDQEAYIRGYFQNFSDAKVKEFLYFIRNSLTNFQENFASIPLQMHMICEAFSNCNFDEFNENFTIVDLYENFVNSKFHLFEDRYFKDCDAAIYDLLEDTRKNTKLQHHILSLLLLFGNDAKFLINNNTEEFMERIRKGREKTGIIVDINDNNEPIFAHRTYAEYLAASWLVENHKNTELILLLFDDDKIMVRLLFDMILTGRNRLFQAIFNADHRQVIEYFDKDECLDQVGRNPLHLACSWGHRYNFPKSPSNSIKIWKNEIFIKFNSENMMKIIEFLLEQNISPIVEDKLLNFTPIQYADLVNNLPAIDRILIDYYQSIELDQLNIYQNFNILLYYCIKYQHLNILKKLLKDSNEETTRITTEDVSDNLLHVAVETGNVDILNFLLNTPLFKQLINNQDKHGNTPLHWAILKGNTDCVRILIESNCDFRQTKLGNSPYQLAIEQARDDIQQILLQYDPSLGQKIDEIHQIHKAALYGDLKTVQRLIDNGTDVNLRDYLNRTPLHCASMHGHYDIVEFLINNRANYDLVDDYGGTPLNWACGEGHLSVVQYLLDVGCDPNLPTNQKVTPLMNAAGEGYLEIVKVLTSQKNVNLDYVNYTGGTALHYATWRGRLHIVRYLVEIGANLYIKNNDGETILQEAYQHGHMEIVKYLLPLFFQIDHQ